MKKHVWFTRIVSIALCLCCLFALAVAEVDQCSHDSWNDDKCVNCGYVCPHTNKEQTNDSFLIESTIRKEYVHPDYHAIYGTLGYDAECTVCHKTFSNVPQQENYFYNNEDHDFDSNYTCKGCGYTCKHSSFDYQGLCSYCGFQCPHGSYSTNAYGAVVCNMCGLQCSHNWQKNGDSVTCTRCNTSCTHTAERSNVISTQSRANYDQLGATQHRKTPYVHRLYNCNMCRFNWEGDVYDEEPVNENHSFVSGACSLCKYVCLYTSWNGGTCSVCGYTCSEHNYVNGVCSTCGAGCPHEHSEKQHGTWLNSVYTILDEEKHHAKYDYADVYTCTDCGKDYTVLVERGREDDEEHEWLMRPNAGLTGCSFCGAKKPCESHAEGSVVSTTDGDKTYTSTAAGHVASFVRTTVYKCSTCDWNYTVDETVTEAQAAHSFSGSTCSVCGYTCSEHNYVNGVCSTCGAGCPHEHSEKQHGTWLNSVYTILDEEKHHAKYDYADVYTCTDCGKDYTVLVERGREDDEEHEWLMRPNAGLTGCSFCGAKKPCESHAEGSVVSTTDGDKTYTSTAAGHVASFVRTTVYKCSTCDWNYTVDETVTEAQAAHSFSGSTCTVCGYTCSEHNYVNGVCSICGYGCAHANAAYNGTDTNKVKSYVDNRDGTHTYSYEVWHNYECPSCKSVTEEYFETVTETKTHDYGSDNLSETCVICGAKKACATHTKTGVVNQTDGEKTYTSQNETQHYAVYDRTTLYDCGVCGWQFSETVQMTDAPTGHTFDQDGVCTLCSHVCKHSYESDVMICPYCGMQAPTKVEEKTVEKALDELPQESKQALAEAGLDTAEKITEKLVETAAEQGYSQEKAVVVDVTLQVQVTDTETNEKKWVEVTTENFPSDGLEVTFDPPEGTNVDDYSFVVVHMFTSPEKAGQVEVLTPTVRDGKLVVTFSALSPVSISWKEKTEIVVNLPKTGDDSRLLLWVALLSISIAVTAVLVMKKRSRT